MESQTHTILVNLLMLFQSMLYDVEYPRHQELKPDYVQDIYCLALNSYHEARGESFEAKVGIAQTVMNRVSDVTGEFRRHNDICGIVKRAHRNGDGSPIRHRCWYSWYCNGVSNRVQLHHPDGQINVLERRAWEESIQAAFFAYHYLYPDLTYGSTHYYNDHIADPHWSDYYETTVRLDNHIFLRPITNEENNNDMYCRC